jgi:hypothetical protein
MPIKICVDGELKFVWNCDEAAIAAMLLEVPKWCRDAGKVPIEYADSCIHKLCTDPEYLQRVDMGLKWGLMAPVCWRILISEAPPDFGYGSISDYAAHLDFDINFAADGSEMPRVWRRQ